MNRRDFLKKSAMGTCAFIVGQGLVLSSCKKEPKKEDKPEPQPEIEPPYIITDVCVGCGKCERVCDSIGINAIYRIEEREDSARQIDPGPCILCGKCKEECPVGAIVLE